MICAICGGLCLGCFCTSCERTLLRSKPKIRTIGDLQVVSLFPYSLLRAALAQKHSMRGWLLMRRLAALAAKHMQTPTQCPILPCEPLKIADYSHTYLLSVYLSPHQSDIGELIDASGTVYKGRSKQWRKNNPRKFSYRPPRAALRARLLSAAINFAPMPGTLREWLLIIGCKKNLVRQKNSQIASLLGKANRKKLAAQQAASDRKSSPRDTVAPAARSKAVTARKTAASCSTASLREWRANPRGAAARLLRERLGGRAICEAVRPTPPEEVILLDDLITTGLTLSHAHKALQKAGIRVKLALCLSDADS